MEYCDCSLEKDISSDSRMLFLCQKHKEFDLDRSVATLNKFVLWLSFE